MIQIIPPILRRKHKIRASPSIKEITCNPISNLKARNCVVEISNTITLPELELLSVGKFVNAPLDAALILTAPEEVLEITGDVFAVDEVASGSVCASFEGDGGGGGGRGGEEQKEKEAEEEERD